MIKHGDKGPALAEGEGRGEAGEACLADYMCARVLSGERLLKLLLGAIHHGNLSKNCHSVISTCAASGAVPKLKRVRRREVGRERRCSMSVELCRAAVILFSVGVPRVHP